MLLQVRLAITVGASTLALQAITWDEAPARVLDYVAEQEVVHPTRVMTRFRRRLGAQLCLCRGVCSV